MDFIFFTPLIFFIIFFLIERRTIWIGFFFVLFTFYVTALSIVYFESIHFQLGIALAIGASLCIILLTPFYILSFIIALISSGIRLINREGRRFHNFLSIGLGVFIIGWIIFTFTFEFTEEQPFLYSLAFLLNSIIIYFFIVMLSFALSSLLNRLRNPFKKYDYIIVLGSGLINGKVPPLLQNRINKGIELYKQSRAKNLSTKVIFTGGQGADEPVAEGIAMAEYAESQGLNKDHIIIEDKAVNTLENIQFSYDLIQKDWQESSKPNIVTVTNNFHVFRALLWTRKVGIKSDGAGAKTKFYFWLNALIREYIGVLSMNRIFHITIVSLIFLLSMTLYFVTKFFVLPIDL